MLESWSCSFKWGRRSILKRVESYGRPWNFGTHQLKILTELLFTNFHFWENYIKQSHKESTFFIWCNWPRNVAFIPLCQRCHDEDSECSDYTLYTHCNIFFMNKKCQFREVWSTKFQFDNKIFAILSLCADKLLNFPHFWILMVLATKILYLYFQSVWHTKFSTNGEHLFSRHSVKN